MKCEDLCPATSRPANFNCLDNDPADGLPVQCVGDWEREKHDPLERYIEASAGPRAGFLNPRSGITPGGAAFVDLYAGPGRARVRSNGLVVDGSPLIALKHEKSRFTKVILCDIDPANADALRSRTATYGDRAVVIEGDCHASIDRIVSEIPPAGLNFALIDPFSLDQLNFDTLARLARFDRMDLLIHYPTMDLKRNWDQGAQDKLTKALGTDEWQKTARSPRDAPRGIETLRKQLMAFGYTGQNVRSLQVENSRRGVLYHLVYVSKHKLGDKIWESIAATTGRGQKSLF